MTELKPCPFCGGDEIYLTVASTVGKVYWAKVDCNRCFCGTSKKDTEEDAIEAWNRRATDGD